MLTYSDIAKIFGEIELRLISSLKRNLGRHKSEEQQYGFDWTAWQAEKIKNINKFRQENARIMNSYTGLIDSQTRQIMLDEFSQGVNGVFPESDREPHFFGVDETKVNKLIEDVTHLEKQAETSALRLTDDVYRQTVNRVQLAMSTGSMTLQQAIDLSVQDFLNQGINSIVYSNGRRVNIEDYVRMALRTTATRANLQGQSAKIKALGYDTVIVSHYSMCSPTCLPWQGQPYIEDVFSEWDGEKRYIGDVIYGKSHYCGKWFPLLSSAVSGGLFHPNCRHTISMWRDGDPIPRPQDNSDNNRRYKLEQQQRKLEREVRKAKRNVAGLSDPNTVKQAKKDLKAAQSKLKDFIEQTNQNEGATILKRDYGREKIYDNSPPTQSTAVPTTPTATEGHSVEVNVGELEKAEGAYTDAPIPNNYTFAEYSKVKSDTPETIVDKSAIGSTEYRKQFDNFDESVKVRRIMCQESRNMLYHRTGTKYEDLSFINTNTGKYITRNDYNKERSVKPTKRMIKMLNDAKPYSIVAIHNHPGSYVPSLDDIGCAYERKYKYGLIACHNGNIFKYQVTGEFNPIIINSLLDKLQRIIYNSGNKQAIDRIELNNTLQQLKNEKVEMRVLLWK